MESYTSLLLKFPDKDLRDDAKYDKAAKVHCQKMDKMMKEPGFVNGAGELINHVNPQTHSLSYLALLTTIFGGISKSEAVPEDLLERVAVFLLQFDQRQIRYAGAAFSSILALVASGEIFPASIAIELLASALQRLDPTGSILTSHHIALVELALETNLIEGVLPVISRDIVFYPGSGSSWAQKPNLACDMSLSPPDYITVQSGLTAKLAPNMVLFYDLLCGMCYIARKEWALAFEALERVLTFPTKDNGCSKIMVEAHNKWVLVGLLLDGRTPIINPITSQAAQKTFSTIGRPYLAVARAFEEKTAETLKMEVEALGTQFWSEENNLGLIKEVLANYQRWQIINLSEIYSKVSLEQIRAQTQNGETAQPLNTVDEVESLLKDMIAEGWLDGVIEKPVNGKPAHLSFNVANGAEERSEAECAAEIAAVAKRIKGLQPLINATNERLSTNKEYIKHLVKEQKREKEQATSHGPGMDQIDDEDLMTGVMAT